jgi:hypothetical protein
MGFNASPFEAFKAIEVLLKEHVPHLYEMWEIRVNPATASIMLDEISVLEEKQPSEHYRRILSMIALYQLVKYDAVLQLAKPTR